MSRLGLLQFMRNNNHPCSNLAVSRSKFFFFFVQLGFPLLLPQCSIISFRKTIQKKKKKEHYLWRTLRYEVHVDIWPFDDEDSYLLTLLTFGRQKLPSWFLFPRPVHHMRGSTLYVACSRYRVANNRLDLRVPSRVCFINFHRFIISSFLPCILIIRAFIAVTPNNRKPLLRRNGRNPHPLLYDSFCAIKTVGPGSISFYGYL
ncbi:hypothetical protein PUN28_005758 [Cardiocondyla obscurior]|uniref:Uncharacterized protein n=1 Tax=Cardiocondyla obscurior TaxID=286306 RepID=A0AAW2GBL1_9HYME